MKLAWKTGKNNSRVLTAESIAKLEIKYFQWLWYVRIYDSAQHLSLTQVEIRESTCSCLGQVMKV